MKRHILAVVFLALAVLVQQKDIFSQGFYPMHDDTQVARVIVMGRALRNGQFPVRWVSDLGYGYGYPIFNFYGPLPYYVGGFFYAVGLPGLEATKLMILMGGILAAWCMYVFLASVWGRVSGVLGAIFYSFSVYHAVQLFVRGAISEYWATIFFPLLLLGIWQIFAHKKKSGILIGAIGTAGVILSHTLLGYVTVMFLCLGVVGFAVLSWRHWKERGVLSLCLIIAMGLSLSAFFWIPAFGEMRYTNVANQISSTANYADHFVCLSQLWDSPWGYGGSAIGCHDGFTFALGKVLIVGALLGAFMIPFVEKKNKYIILLGIGISVVSIFFLLDNSLSLWKVLPYFAFLQYPWRFLAFTIFGMSMLTAVIVVPFRSRWIKIGIGTILIVLCVFFNMRWFHPQYTYPKTDAEFESDTDIRFRVSKISDEYLPPQIPRPQTVNDVVHDTIVRKDTYGVKTVIDRETYKKYEITTRGTEEIQVNLAAFPGWQYVVNGQLAHYRIEHGIPFLTVPLGFSTMELTYIGTPIQKFGDFISIITVIGIIYYYGKKTIA